jgi:hypothetical protein
MNQADKQELKNLLNSRLKPVIIVLGGLILAAYLMRGCKAEAKLAEVETMNKALEDSLTTWRDREGDFKANITLLENENADYFTKWNTADANVIKLQALVTKYKKQLGSKGSATVITTDADIDITEPTIVYRDTTKPCDPVYKTDFEIMGTGKYEKTRWVWGVVHATKDSTTVGMRFHEEIDVVLGQEKTGFLGLGKPRPFAEVTLHNPFNKVSTLRSFNVTPPKPKKFGIGPTLSYGVGSGFVPQVFVGIGVNYSILRL